jgi:polyisoprenyl-phosphate glycosyltransferase
MESMKRTISFSIPVYNNAGSLAETHKRISSLFQSKLAEYAYEIIFINDGSKDTSWDEIMQIKKADMNVKLIQMSRNFGQNAATISGHRMCKGDCCITLSADLQDPADMIPNMVTAWENGAAVVVNYRIGRQDSFIEGVTSKIFFSFLKRIYPQMPVGGFDFYLLDRKPLNVLNSITDTIRNLHTDIFSLGFPMTLLPYERQKRTIGRSGYSFSKRLMVAFDSIINNSYLPIRYMSVLGLVTSFLGFIYASSIFVSWILNKPLPGEGWAPIMVAVLLIGGLLMLMIGVLGEYMWRIYAETKNRPYYIIQETHGWENNSDELIHKKGDE